MIYSFTRIWHTVENPPKMNNPDQAGTADWHIERSAKFFSRPSTDQQSNPINGWFVRLVKVMKSFDEYPFGALDIMTIPFPCFYE